MRLLTKLALIAALCGIVRAAAPTTQLSDDDIAGNAALARRFCQLAQVSLSAQDIVPATLDQSIALLKLAARMDPTESSYPRLVVEAYLQPCLNGPEARAGAIEALNRYLQLQPDSIYAKARLIDLHYQQMEAADQRERYVQQLLSTTGLPAELQAHVAVMGAKLAMDRAEVSKASGYIEQALKQFPLCPEALAMKYAQLPDDTPAPERMALLMQMLRSNPAQPEVMHEIADLAASVGLVDPSMYWYSAHLGLVQMVGQSPSDEVLTALAEEFVVADQLGASEKLARSLVERDAGNSEAAFIVLLLERNSAPPDKIDQVADVVKTTLTTRLSRISDSLNGRAATTQPSTTTDIPGDLKKLADSQNPNLSAAYAAALSDLAWLDIYFRTKPSDAQPYMEALRQLLSPESVTLARLDGWTYLVQGQKDEARVKLSAVAESDPFSALGMLRLDTDQVSADKLAARARKLVMDNPSGLTGAVLIDALREQIGMLPTPPIAASVRAEMKFPKDFLDIIDTSKSKNFYLVKAEPQKVSHAFGESMFVKVSITNVSNYPLTVGPEGALHTDLWFDVRLSGVQQQNIPGAAFDRMGQTMQLKPHDTISQTVRIDQGPLTTALQANPQVAIPFYGSVVINPSMQGSVVPGPCGCRVQFSRIMKREPSPQDGGFMQRVLDQSENGRADVRFRTIELMTAFASSMLQQTNEDLKSRGGDLAELVHKSVNDRSVAVRSHAMFMSAMMSKPAVRLAMFKQMLGDESYIMRAEALAALSSATDTATLKDLARPISESDPDPLIRDLAKSVIEVAELPPPTTRPADSDPSKIPGSTTAPSQLDSVPVPGAIPVPGATPSKSTPDQPAKAPAPSDSPYGGFKL